MRFDDFFEKLDGQYHSMAQREELKRLEIMMHWLADQTSLELALKQVCRKRRRLLSLRNCCSYASGLVKSADLLTPSEPDAGSSAPDGTI